MEKGILKMRIYRLKKDDDAIFFVLEIFADRSSKSVGNEIFKPQIIGMRLSCHISRKAYFTYCSCYRIYYLNSIMNINMNLMSMGCVKVFSVKSSVVKVIIL